jgi:methylmalonyl-CoA/ethylmalonyl-CoA epimerase
MTIDHICFAVRNLEEGVRYWKDVFGYRRKTEMVVNTLQRVKVSFVEKENSLTIKLIEPLEGNLSLLNFVSRGGGFHHICFKCDNIEEGTEELKEKGLITLVPPQPGEAFNNHKIAFFLAKYGVNIELIDTDERAALL